MKHINKTISITAFKETLKKSKNDIHIIPSKGKWIIQKRTANKTSVICDTMNSAIQTAESDASTSPSLPTKLIIHNRIGEVEKTINISPSAKKRQKRLVSKINPCSIIK